MEVCGGPGRSRPMSNPYKPKRPFVDAPVAKWRMTVLEPMVKSGSAPATRSFALTSPWSPK